MQGIFCLAKEVLLFEEQLLCGGLVVKDFHL